MEVLIVKVVVLLAEIVDEFDGDDEAERYCESNDFDCLNELELELVVGAEFELKKDES